MARLVWLRARRSAAAAGAVCAVLTGAVAAPTAAHAQTADLAAAISPVSITGRAGTEAALTATVINNDPDADSGPASFVLSLAGSTLVEIYSYGGTCSVTTATCDFPYGIPAGSATAVSARIQLNNNGSVTATAVLPGDVNPANDSATATVAIEIPPVPPIPPVARPALLSLTASPHPVAAGSVVHLTTSITDSAGKPVPYAYVKLLRKLAGAADFTFIAGANIGGGGKGTFDDHPTANATYKAVFTEDPSLFLGPGESPPVVVGVSYAVTAEASPVTVPPGSVVTVSLTVDAGVTGAKVTVQQRFGTGLWVTVGHPKLTTGGKATVALPALGKKGTYTFRVIKAADTVRDEGSAQAKVVVTTTGKGNAASWAPLIGSQAGPVRWNPCTPIVYYINPRHMPPGGMADVKEALRRISIVGGLTFRYGGPSNVVPSYRNFGPPGLLIVFATSAETGGLLPAYANGGFGGITDYVGRRATAGFAIINADSVKAPNGLASGFGEGYPVGLVLMHEIGHAMGLAHVEDPWSIMLAIGGRLPAAVWSAGDMTGLRALGRPAGCL